MSQMNSSTGTGRVALSAGRALAWARHVSLEAWVTTGIGVLALASRLALLGVFSAEYDEGVYWQSLRAMAAGHPLYRQVFSSQPPLFLLSIYPFYRLFGQTLGAARFGVACFSLAGLAALYFAGRLAGGGWAGVIVLALATVDPLFLHASVTLQAEGPSIALSAVAVALALATVRSNATVRRWLAIGTGAVLMAAILIKLFTIVALVPVAIILTFPLVTSAPKAYGSRWTRVPVAPARAQRRGMRPVRRWGAVLLRPAEHSLAWGQIRARIGEVAPDGAWCAAGMLGIALVVLLPFAPSWSALAAQDFGFHLAAAGSGNGGLRAHWQIISETLGWLPLTLPSLVAVGLVLWRRVWALVPALLWAAASLVLLLRLQPLFMHHVVLLAPPLTLAGGVALDRGLREQVRLQLRSVGEVRMVRLVAAVLLVVAVLAGAKNCLNMLTTARQYVPTTQLQMAAALDKLTAPTDIVVSDDPYVAALANRDVPPQLVDTSSVRIASGYLTTTQLEALITSSHARAVLFASGRFDQTPGFRGWVARHYSLAIAFGDGHALYLRQARARAASRADGPPMGDTPHWQMAHVMEYERHVTLVFPHTPAIVHVAAAPMGSVEVEGAMLYAWKPYRLVAYAARAKGR